LSATDLVVDLSGYDAPAAAGRFSATAPSRVLDTRTGLGASGPVASGGEVRLALGAPDGIAPGASAIALNLTATDTAADGYASAYPCGSPPEVSNLNYRAGTTVANLVVVPVAGDGSVCLSTFAGAQLVADVIGWFGATAAGQFTPLSPTRLLDTRLGLSGTRLAAGATLVLNVGSLAALSASSRAVSINVTAVNGGANGYVTVFPCGGPVPGSSNVNYSTGSIVPNMVLASMSSSGTVCLYSYAAVDLVVDIAGVFS
jgi:hypothetical protein